MKRISYTLLSISVMLAFASCSKNNTTTDKQTPHQVELNTDAAELSKRITTKGDGLGVVSISPVSNPGGRSAEAAVSSNKYPMELIAEVAPPVYQGTVLRATHVDINGNYAYVSYNKEGEKYRGGIQVFDISNTSAPKLVAEAMFPNTDLSAVVFNNNRLYFSGATSVDEDPTLKSPGLVGYIDIVNGIPATTYKFASVQGQVATDIALANNKLYVASGSTGGLTVMDPLTLEQEQYIVSGDLRAVAANSNKVATLSGETGLYFYNPQGLAQLANIATGQDIAESKRTIAFNNNYLLVAAGRMGVQYYNTADYKLAGELRLPTVAPPGIDINEYVTNAVSVNDGLFLAANGAAGLYACNETSTHGLELLGAIDLDGSSNYVKIKGDYIFVATGKGGLKIIKLVRPATNTACDNLPAYTGDVNLNVNSGQKLSYSGSVALQNVNVNASLFYCGSMTIQNSCNINSNGKFELHGTLAFGQYGKSNALIINNNASLDIEGSLVIYGDLILNSGAKLNFIGNGSTVSIYGKVTKGNNVTITGNYTDVFNNLK
jgi:hypothetical protein